MKRYLFYILILITLPLIFAACEDKIETYSSMDRVYFSQSDNDGQPDSLYINLKEYTSEGIVYVNDSVIQVPLKVLGTVSSVDRTVSVVQADVNSYSWIKRRLWDKLKQYQAPILLLRIASFRPIMRWVMQILGSRTQMH